MKLKQETKKLHPFFEKKRLFLENCQIIGHNKKHKMTTERAKIAWNHNKIG